jgi:hypothetical protein
VSKQLEVEILPCDDATECTCPLCGELLSLSSFVGMLYDGDHPLGCICEKCLGESPKQVAGRLRERVVDLYEFIQKAHESLSGEAWGRCIEKVRSRAEHWDALASRIACLEVWPIMERAHCSAANVSSF